MGAAHPTWLALGSRVDAGSVRRDLGGLNGAGTPGRALRPGVPALAGPWSGPLGLGHWKVISKPSVKFDTGMPKMASRNHVVKFQVSPACTETGPVGWGTWVRSSRSENVPVDPEFWICPGPT